MARTFFYNLVILERHIDTFGHVNHATYLQILEEARWNLVTKGGWGMKRVQSSGVGSIILGAQLKFRRELLLREEIQVTTVCVSYRNVVGKLRHEIKKADGTLACTAEMDFGLFDLRSRKLLKPTQEWLTVLGYAPGEKPA